jgi:hypothetical protein
MRKSARLHQQVAVEILFDNGIGKRYVLPLECVEQIIFDLE